jgi:hypothetical protein
MVQIFVMCCELLVEVVDDEKEVVEKVFYPHDGFEIGVVVGVVGFVGVADVRCVFVH